MRDLHACHEHRPELAMVDSAKGITNFHSPNDIIVDASMPAMIRNGGKMWGADGRLKDVKAVMPESTFARIYQEMISFRSEEHTSELQSLMRISYAVFCSKKKIVTLRWITLNRSHTKLQ